MKKFLMIINIFILTLCAITLTACGENFSKFSLSFSSTSIDLTLNEEKEFDIKIDNYFDTEVNFNFDFDKSIAKVDENNIVNLGDGTYRIKVKALMTGTTTLTITLLEGNKKCVIPVNVYEPVTNFSLKDDVDLYVVRGQSITFSSDMFNFYPQTTLQKDLTFSVNSIVLENDSYSASFDAPNVVIVTATSKHNSSLNRNFELHVLDEIDIEAISISYNNEIVLPLEKDENSYIEIISNDDVDFKKTYIMSYDETKNYDFEFISKSTNELFTSSKWELENKYSIDIINQNEEIVEDTLIIRVYDASYRQYYRDIEYKIKFVYIPESVKINGQTTVEQVDLFDNNLESSVKRAKISINPSKATYSNVTIEFYVENIITGILTKISYDEIKEYLCVKYKGIEIIDNQIINDLSAEIEYYGRKVLPSDLYGENVYIRFVCNSEYLETPIYNEIPVIIRRSATDFYVSEEYINSTIYVSTNDDVVTFDGFVVKEDGAYVGKIIAVADYLSSGYVEVSQTQDNLASIDIRPLKQGQATYTLILSSGISTRLTIIVKEEFEIDDFWLYVAPNNTDNVAEVTYKNIRDNSTLSSVVLRGLGEFEIITNIVPKNIDKDMYSLTYRSSNPDSISIENNKVKAKKIDNQTYKIIVELSLKKVDQFKIVDDIMFQNNTEYSFDIKCFQPISSFSVVGANAGQNNQSYTSKTEVYVGNIGEVDQLMSEVNIKLLIDNNEPEDDDARLSDITWSFSTTSILIDDGVYELSESGSQIGYFYANEMRFVCRSSNSSGYIRITAEIMEYGKAVSASIQIDIQSYVQVNNIWLNNYVEQIYLDAVYNEITLYPYIVPSDATNKNYVVWFEPKDGTSQSIVQLEYDSSYIKLSYAGRGGGQGTLHIVPSSKYSGESSGDGTLYESSLNLDVYIGEGTIENPLHIRTWEEFKNIDLTKHYIIDTIIDAQGEEIAPLGELTGGIKGYVTNIVNNKITRENVGGIVNFVIKNPTTIRGVDYYGLFTNISSTGYLTNLTISGKIDITETTSNNSYIGAVCGVNNGLIKNVNVNLLKSSISSNGTNNLFIGGLCGKNNGSILTDIIEKEAGDIVENIDNEKSIGENTLFNDYETTNSGTINPNYETIVPNSTIMVQMYDEFNVFVNKTNDETLYLGGIVGNNNGLVGFRNNNDYIKYNLYGTSNVVDILVSGAINNSYIGGVAGYNDGGNIINVLAKGIVEANNFSHVAGIIGSLNKGKILNNTTKVFVRGKNYVAGLVGLVSQDAGENVNITENIVEAIDEGKTGTDVSLIISNKGDDGKDCAHLYFLGTSAVKDDGKNICQTYVNRNIITDGENENLTNYYGDVIKISADGITKRETFNKALNVINFSEIIDTVKYPQNTVILMYYKAVDITNQSLLKQFNTQKLPYDLLLEQYKNLEISITSSASSVISISASGELILNSTGMSILTLSSSNNYKDKVEIKVIVTNYIYGLEMYLTSDRLNSAITSVNVLNVNNRNILNLYPKYVGQVTTINGYKIDTIENTEALLEIEADESYVSVKQSGRTVMLQGNGTNNSTTNLPLDFYVYIPVVTNGVETRYYLVNNQDGNIFVANGKNNPNLQLNMNYTQGIYNIGLDKTIMEIVPSDVINVRVQYLTDDENDRLNLLMKYIETGVFIEYSPENESAFSEYFKTVIVSEPKFDNGKYYVDYTFELNTETEVKLGEYEFVFSSSISGVSKTLSVKYSSQPMDSVIIKNYTFADNQNIELGTLDDGSIIYNTSYTMQETNTITAGKTNILRIVVNPYYADYSYIEVTNDNSNINNGKVVLFGLLKQYNNQPNQAVVSTNGYTTANGIRVYKKDIQGGDLQILYRLHTNVIEGDSVTLNINFYNKNGEVVYSQEQKVLTIAIDKSIEVSIVGKENSNGKYYLARGMSYALDVKSVGYDTDEIYITSSSPYITVKRDGNLFYLQVAQDINYIINQEGADVLISYYGKRQVNGQMIESSKNSFVCTVVEYVFDDFDIDDMFADNEILLGVGNAVDIRDKIIDKLNIEYSQSATGAVSLLKESIKQNASFYYKKGDVYSWLNSETNDEVQKEYKLNGYVYTPLKVGDNLFSFGIYLELYYLQGYLVVKEVEKPEEISQSDIKTFDISVVQSSLEDAPLPLYSAEDLTRMIDGNYYRLMADIELPYAFSPITAKIKSLDGNGKKIIINSGVYKDNEAYTNVEKYGIFETIDSDTVISNLTIEISGFGTTMFSFDNSLSTNSFNFGLLAGENNGVITNCFVTMSNSTSSLIVANNSSVSNTNTSYIAGLVAVNNGFITNSRVNLKIESSGANLSGLVAVNNGHIASSYVKDSLIKNSSSNANNSTGGLVVLNNGTIITSFIEGSYNEGIIKIYAENTTNIVSASSIAGAFVYQNSGTIEDCYANIPVVASSRNSGFVFANNGTIKRCYTTSKLGDGDYENYPFIVSQGENSSVESCYYLSDDLFNVNVNQSNKNIDGLRPTSLSEFVTRHKVENNVVQEEELFTEFVVNKNEEINSGVWFFAQTDNAHEFNVGDTISTMDHQKYIQNTSYVTYAQYSYKGTAQQFVANRLQLVSANTLAYSEKELISSYDEETNIYTYNYFTSSVYAEEGSKYNPIIIYSASQFENHILNNSLKNVNTLNYRFVKDINYADENLVVSSLYKTTFAGYIEGNGMEISGFSINTNESLLSSGYFAQIGNGVGYATVQNLIFSPKYINLPNAYNVGTVAGTVNKSYIYNINVDAYKLNSQGMVILGRNIVGGIFGRTTSSFDINGLYSSISVNAYYTNLSADYSSDGVQEKILYEEMGTNTDTVSYAGSIVGYVAGTGTIKNPKITNDVASIGMICGFMFGGIGINATVENINLVTSYGQQNFIRASAYAGLIVGDLKGTLKDVLVEKPQNQEKLYDLFRLEPKVPLAVGGVSGIVRGGTIENVNIYEDITFENTKSLLPNAVGGLCGKVLQTVTINNFNYYGQNIVGRSVVGGVIGELKLDANKNVNVNLTNINIGVDNKTTIKMQKPASDEDTIEMYIGGVVGKIASDYANNEDMSKTITLDQISLNAIIETDIKVYGSILTGDIISTSFYLSVGYLFGGYDGNGINGNVNFDAWEFNISEPTVNVETKINVQNIRNGNNSNGIPKEFQISFGYIIGFESSLNENNTITVVINSKSFNVNGYEVNWTTND